MNYIYDIYINFNQDYYDTYEWLNKDKIIHLKKIPIFRISTNDLKKIITYKIQLEERLVNDIKKACESLKKRNGAIICAFTDIKDEIVVQISKEGNIIKKSSIHFTDKFNSFLIIKQLKLIDFNYKIISEFPVNLTIRNEEEKKKLLIKLIDKLDEEKLIYLYFECFNKKAEQELQTKNKLKKEIINGNEKINSIVENFFKLFFIH